jgi:hypothetical protein
MNKIWPDDPTDWRELQERVRVLFEEMGCVSDTEAAVPLARGSVNVDVRVIDSLGQPNALYICECKHWSKSVPKSVVHSFRTVLSDSGAHTGFLISKRGFQSGAIEAAKHSNVVLVTWSELQAMFYDRWCAAMTRRLLADGELIFDYMDVLDDRVSEALDSGDDAKSMFYGFFRRYAAYAKFNTWSALINGSPTFPIECPDPRTIGGDIVLFSSPREFFDVLREWRPKAAKAFEMFLDKYGGKS